MQRVVVVYDIADNKRRRRVGEILEGYGIRVNRSVFECRLKNEVMRRKLEKEILQEIDPAVDSVRIYEICRAYVKKATVLGDEPLPFDTDTIYFF